MSNLIDALKALMVIPRTPEPESSPLDGLTDEQRREVEEYAEMLKVMTTVLPNSCS
jgi:hypothetical protein